jgi:hypothetical protein
MPRRTTPRQAVLLGVTGVVIGLVVLGGLAVLASRGDVRLQGDPVFDAGRTDSQAPAIERDGPILLGDVAGGDRDVYLQHLGDDEDRGWLAFDTRAPGASRDCAVRWVPEGEAFEDPCSGERYPADGEGLRQYPVDVEDGRLTVDLRRE